MLSQRKVEESYEERVSRLNGVKKVLYCTLNTELHVKRHALHDPFIIISPFDSLIAGTTGQTYITVDRCGLADTGVL